MNKRTVSTWPLTLIGLFILSIAFYLPALMGDKIWDDLELVSGHAFGGNTFLAAFTKPFLGRYFRPLTSASFVLDSSFASQTPFFYHQTNILLHAITTVLVACLALVVTKKQIAGVFAGLFFATQPLQVGAAAWIGGRTDVLSAMFLAGFMVALVLYHQSSKRGWLITSTVSLFLAALSKEQALAILPAVPLSVFVFGSGRWKDAVRLCLPYAVAVVIFLGLWIIDAPAPFGVKSSLATLATLPFRTFSLYGLAFLTPNEPSLQSYTLENYRGLPWVMAGLVLAIGAIWFIKGCWKNHRELSWLAICALLVYLPISNFPPVPSFVVAPYRCGEAGTAVACLFGIGAAYAVVARRYILALALGANLVAGTFVASWGIHQWLTPPGLFKTQAQIDPHFLAGVRNYGQSLEEQRDYTEELRLTNITLSWLFDTPNWQGLLADKGWAAMTPATVERLKSNGGEADYKALAAFISTNASALANLRRTDEAIVVEKEALIFGQKDPRIHYAYANLILSTNRPEAIHQFEIALSQAPRYSACALALAHERIVDGRYVDAVKLLEPVMADIGWEANPWLELTKARIGLGDTPGAQRALNQAAHTMNASMVKVQIQDLQQQIASRRR